jgi:hypothetical protein
MKFESNTSLCKDNSENEEYVFDDTEDGTIEPSIDYNDKQVRFSSIVLDAEEDIFKPLKEETISPAINVVRSGKELPILSPSLSSPSLLYSK